MRRWIFASVLIAFGLLAAVYLVARVSTPDPTGIYIPGLVPTGRTSRTSG